MIIVPMPEGHDVHLRDDAGFGIYHLLMYGEWDG